MKNKSKKSLFIQDVSKQYQTVYKPKNLNKRRKKKTKKRGFVKKYLFKFLFKGIEIIWIIIQVVQTFINFFKNK